MCNMSMIFNILVKVVIVKLAVAIANGIISATPYIMNFVKTFVFANWQAIKFIAYYVVFFVAGFLFPWVTISFLLLMGIAKHVAKRN